LIKLILMYGSWQHKLLDGFSAPRTDDSLEALIESIKVAPHEFTTETNRNCARILNHGELDLSKLPGSLRCFESYNGTV